jgi:hypothetical protein
LNDTLRDQPGKSGFSWEVPELHGLLRCLANGYRGEGAQVQMAAAGGASCDKHIKT